MPPFDPEQTTPAALNFLQNAPVPDTKWTTERADAWYKEQAWLVGANYIPSDAINQFEMFQAETWNAAINDRELGMAASLGMNCVRVFLQDQLWLNDPAGTRDRIDAFLEIAHGHGIRAMLVLFDSCWNNDPKPGPQPLPKPGVHNSGWVQSPGRERLHDRSKEPELRAYTQGVIEAFRTDRRVLSWDLWNEPDNRGNDRVEDEFAKVERVDELLPQVFSWAREIRPDQPLTSGVWAGAWQSEDVLSPTARIQLAQSDIVTFHNYSWPEEFECRIQALRRLGRPILCTEYMARCNGSIFDLALPIAKRENVAVMNWGLVAGKTQTWLPWDSWERPYLHNQPVVWFHEIFRPDGSPYRQREVDVLREMTDRDTPPPEGGFRVTTASPNSSNPAPEPPPFPVQPVS